MKVYKADLHIHTCLSPCSELEMTPRRIVRRALELGLDIIAVADHNGAENAGAAMEAARKAGGGLTVLAAMEITSREEAHVLGIFPSLDAALGMQALVYESLEEGARPVRDHYQVIVNEDEEVLGFSPRCHLCRTGLGVRDIMDRVHEHGGLAIPAHVDRAMFSLSSQFGFIPEGLRADAFEAVDPWMAERMLEAYPETTVVSNSDSHRLGDMGRRYTELGMKAPGFEELRKALGGIGDRTVRAVTHA